MIYTKCGYRIARFSVKHGGANTTQRQFLCQAGYIREVYGRYLVIRAQECVHDVIMDPIYTVPTHLYISKRS